MRKNKTSETSLAITRTLLLEAAANLREVKVLGEKISIPEARALLCGVEITKSVYLGGGITLLVNLFCPDLSDIYRTKKI